MSADALARRIDISGDMIYPDCFLETMEENGTVVELDRLILRKVCMNLADRMAKGLPVVRTSVNLSRLHIQAPGAVDMLHDIAQAYRIPPSLLEFELLLIKQFLPNICLLYTSDAADERSSVVLCGRRKLKKKNNEVV